MKYTILFALLISAGCASNKTQPSEKKTAETSKTPTPIVQSSASEVSNKLTCTNAKDVRLLEIVSKTKGCDLHYTKSGKMTIASSSTVSSKHCEDSKKKIRSKLEKSGYQCM